LIITKYNHACLLVETEDRAAIFDPGSMSEGILDVSKISKLDDIFITHIHQDHFYIPLIKQLIEKFNDVRITSTDEVVAKLNEEGVKASSNTPSGVTFFSSPHESVESLLPTPEEIGIHYLDLLSDPGDSHSFKETKEILALPITAPWGSSIKALNLVIDLKPKYVIPIHDWHWNDKAKEQMYNSFEKVLADRNIKFYKPINGEPITIDV